MTEVSTIGLDIAKSVFQVHGVDASGSVVVRRRLKRAQMEPFFSRLAPTLIGLEACGSAHHWARTLARLGHTVRLMPAAYVKAYVKRSKTDGRDAEACCEAVRRPTMRFVPVKTEEAQAARGLFRVRDLLVRQRTQIGNTLRGLCAEFGLVTREGAAGLGQLCAAIAAQGESAATKGAPEPGIPELLRPGLAMLAGQWRDLDREARAIEARIVQSTKDDAVAKRLMTIPGVGPLTAAAIQAAVPDPAVFRSARDFSAWVGLTPRQCSSGNTLRSGSITKAGDPALRRLLVLGASAVLRQTRSRPAGATTWLTGLLARRPVKVAIVAQAAKTARIVMAVLRSSQPYRPPQTAAAI